MKTLLPLALLAITLLGFASCQSKTDTQAQPDYARLDSVLTAAVADTSTKYVLHEDSLDKFTTMNEDEFLLIDAFSKLVIPNHGPSVNDSTWTPAGEGSGKDAITKIAADLFNKLGKDRIYLLRIQHPTDSTFAVAYQTVE